MKVVGKYLNSFSANVAKGMLESAGIKAAVMNEYLPIISGITNDDLLSITLVASGSGFQCRIELLAERPYDRLLQKPEDFYSLLPPLFKGLVADTPSVQVQSCFSVR